MRSMLSVFLALIMLFSLRGQDRNQGVCPPSKTDAYSVAFVSATFEYFKNSGKKGMRSSMDADRFINAYHSPSLPDLGDAVSIAILKTCDLSELARHENAQEYLTLIRISFSNRQRVVEQSDREPRVTSLVLEYLKEKEVSDFQMEKRITYLNECTKDFTCSSQGEYDFVKSH